MFNFLKKINHIRLKRRNLKKLISRESELTKFGPNAKAIYVQTKQGDFLVDPRDNFVAKKLLNDGKYSLHEVKLASRFLKTNSYCLVLGGHIGSLVIPLAKLCKELIVFEANPDSFILLNKNLLLNKIFNVQTYNKAVSNQNKQLKFLVSKDNSGGSKRLPVIRASGYFYDNPKEIRVDGIVLDKFLKHKSFDLVFVDIEGSEYFAFQGMQTIFKQSKVLITEFIPHHLKYVASVSVVDFWSTLEPHFKYLYIPESKKVFESSTDILKQLTLMFDSDKSYDNIVFLKINIFKLNY
jgi:FkbM family methyltransferase